MTLKVLLPAVLTLIFNSVPSARAQTAASPATNWQASATVGLTIARGNADTTLFSFATAAEKKWTNNDLKLGADILYGTSRTPGESSSVETADRDHAFTQFNHNFTDRFYGYVMVDGLHDGIADIQYRVNVGPGVGYYFIKNKTMDLSLEGGPGFIDEKLGDETLSYVTLRAAEAFHYQISPHSKLWETVECLPQVDYLDNYIVNAEVGIEAGLNKNNKLALRVVFDDSYDNVPAPDRLKNDLKLIAGITYKF